MCFQISLLPNKTTNRDTVTGMSDLPKGKRTAALPAEHRKALDILLKEHMVKFTTTPYKQCLPSQTTSHSSQSWRIPSLPFQGIPFHILIILMQLFIAAQLQHPASRVQSVWEATRYWVVSSNRVGAGGLKTSNHILLQSVKRKTIFSHPFLKKYSSLTQEIRINN